MVEVDMTAVDARAAELRPCPSWCADHWGVDPGEPQDSIFHLGTTIEYPVDGSTKTLLVQLAAYDSYNVAEETFNGPREFYVELRDSPESWPLQLADSDTRELAEHIDRAVAAHAETAEQGGTCPSWCVIDHAGEPEDPHAQGWQTHNGPPATISVRRPKYTDLIDVLLAVNDCYDEREILVELSAHGAHVGDWLAWMPLTTAHRFTGGLREALDRLRD